MSVYLSMPLWLIGGFLLGAGAAVIVYMGLVVFLHWLNDQTLLL